MFAKINSLKVYNPNINLSKFDPLKPSRSSRSVLFTSFGYENSIPSFFGSHSIIYIYMDLRPTVVDDQCGYCCG